MIDPRIILSGLWVATMLTFLWGDVLGLISGDTEPGKLGDRVYDGDSIRIEHLIPGLSEHTIPELIEHSIPEIILINSVRYKLFTY